MATKQKEKHTEQKLDDDTTKDSGKKDLQFNLSSEERFENEIEETTINILLNRIYNFLRMVGLTTIKTGKSICNNVSHFYIRFLKRHVEKVEEAFLRAFKVVFKGIRFVGFKVNMFLHFFVDAKNVLKTAFNKQKDQSFSVRLKDTNQAFRQGVRNNKRVFTTMVNYIIPVAATVGFVFLVNYVSGLHFAVSVEYNGNHIGYIENETVFEKAEATLQERMIYLNEEEKIDKLPKFTVAVVPKEEIKDDSQLTDAIIQSSDKDIVQATGISIDGKFYGAVKDGETVAQLLEEKKEKFKTGKPDEEIKFTKDIQLKQGLFLADNMKKQEEVVALLDGEEEKDAYYQVEEGDTPIIIAAKNDISVDELVKMNPEIMTKLLIGQSVLVNKSQPFLPVSVITTETYTAEVSFETKVTESSKVYKGQSSVSRKGVKGEDLVTAKVQRVNGIEIGREVVTSVRTKEPVDQLVTKGTGSFYQDDSPYTGSMSGAGFIWPVTGGYISSPFGGARRHTGLDIAFRGNGYGSPIRAAAAGKVVFAGWGGSYGRMVKIDHGNGVQTWYAHSSSLLVSPGDIVSQGQTIARVGSTGNSTGNHLHFEVHLNGARQNPIKWLP
jgi:murein DD-endopeptidase MepM/ murein hydrolase activator NlpD